MTRHEKLVLLIIGLLLLTRFGVLAREFYIAQHYGAFGLPPHDKQLWHDASLVWGGLINVGAAIWLAVEARAAALKTWIWALFGLCFGLLGVALFYLSQLYARGRVAET